ncbi:homoserine kinase [Saccharospirillum sp. MSK14-1]|uniref:homoserine kinase n=1 Tax=Saccharospirillum sp. MSK14-1 TaxID=1897632 RepID=UPI000D3991D8|nr:homoserine kinase [Saccharospirillum sp. MSK14-1]PTY38002.1 homoserine kinase [Saccharospirillum sp. MSK14-1]
MSVFTELTRSDIETLLDQYTLGRYSDHQGISAGTENTNYFIDTNLSRFVLTIFEKLHADELPFFLSLGEHLHDDNCAVPQPYRTAEGELLTVLKDKPAVMFERVIGQHHQASPKHAQTLARALANIHTSTAKFNGQRIHSHGATWIHQQAVHLAPGFDSADQALLTEALQSIDTLPRNLPRGVIHADLFHDNALFDGDDLAGIIDWYFAGIDHYALDIAVCLIDWCLNIDGQLDWQQSLDFVQAYHQQRPLQRDELEAMPALVVQAATRFWLSRALAFDEHADPSQITIKDPTAMKVLAHQALQEGAKFGEMLLHELD